MIVEKLDYKLEVKLVPGMASLFVKKVKGRFNVRLDDSVGWGVIICVVNWGCICFHGKISKYKVESVLILMTV